MTFTEKDCQQCRADFPSLQRTHNGLPLVYFDGPAGTQVPQSVIDAISDYYCTSNANIAGAFETSIETGHVVRQARQMLATFLGAASPETISLGPNMTTLTYALSHALGRTMVPGDEIVITELDHEANRGPWLGLRERGMVVKEAAMQCDGTLDYEDMARQITDRTRLVAVGCSSNALGSVNDVKRVRDMARQVKAQILIDAVHYAPHFPMDVAELDVDYLVCSAYKFYGPHVGVLYARPGLLDRLPTDRVRAQYPQGPYCIEMGTLNFAALAGVTAAIEYLARWGEGNDLRSRLSSAMRAIHIHEHALAAAYYDGASSIPGVKVWGPPFGLGRRTPTVSITVEGVEPAQVAQHLAERGIHAWSGHFYAMRPLEVLGLDEQGGLVRTGVSMYNTRDEIDRLLQAIEDLPRV